jgi:phiEco32-like amidoligase-type 2 protein
MKEKEKLVNNLTLGSDPELFLFSEEMGKYIPVCGLIGGTKEEPKPISEEGHFVQEDNVALEFCIPPCTSQEEWVKHINFVKDYVTNDLLQPLGLVPKYVASCKFDIDDLLSPQAAHFGCTPSFNAWTGERMIVDREDPTLRTTGMHVHFGYDNPDTDISMAIIQAADLFLGVQSVLLDPDTERRKMYGKAGDYRLKKYGVEYRSLSGYFLENDTLIKWVYDNAKRAVDFVNANGIITNPQDIQDCINNCDKELALEILDDYNIEVLQLETN